MRPLDPRGTLRNSLRARIHALKGFFQTLRNMATLYLIVSIVLGGCLALFGAAGWSSYKDKKLPSTPDLFRWFVAGALSMGMAAYAWIFGAGGDPSALLEKLGDSLEVKGIAETLTSAVGTTGEAVAESAKKVAESAGDLTVGMPTF